MDRTVKHLSLCTGYGGIDIGLKRVGIPVRTLAYVEIEAFACQNLVSKMEKGWFDVAPIWTNLKTFPFYQFRGKVDILSGGFPCQPFSGAGLRQGVEDPRHLWPYIEEGIRELGRPPIIFFENVEGIISSKINGESVLKHVLKRMESLGYEASAGVFSASEVGASHQRKRVFLLGVNSKLSREGRNIITRFLSSSKSRTAYPTKVGREQYCFEPPRTLLGNTNDERLEGEISEAQPREESATSTPRPSTYGNVQGEVESSMGRNSYGSSDRMDISRSYTNYSNRTDELRLLGNGVLPETCSVAFSELWKDINLV